MRIYNTLNGHNDDITYDEFVESGRKHACIDPVAFYTYDVIESRLAEIWCAIDRANRHRYRSERTLVNLHKRLQRELFRYHAMKRLGI